MKKRFLYLSLFFTFGFIAWTVAVGLIDVSAIGPLGSEVGFSHLNGAFHRCTGVNLWLYNATDILGLLPIGLAFGYALLGLSQWIKRKSFNLIYLRVRIRRS